MAYDRSRRLVRQVAATGIAMNRAEWQALKKKLGARQARRARCRSYALKRERLAKEKRT
jgi:primosomal protein N''